MHLDHPATTPRPQSVEKLFHETSLWCQKAGPTAAPGEKPDLQGSQPTSSFHKIFLSLIEHHLVGTSPLVLILLLGRVDLDFFPGLGVCYQFTM